MCSTYVHITVHKTLLLYLIYLLKIGGYYFSSEYNYL